MIRQIFIMILLVCNVNILSAKENQSWYSDAMKAFESGDYATCQKLFHKYAPKSTFSYQKQHNVSIVPWFESAIALNDWEDAVEALTQWPMRNGIYNGMTIDNKQYWLTADGLRDWSKENAPIHNLVWTDMVYFYWDKLELFDRSPFVKHMVGIGKATLEEERLILAESIHDVAKLAWEGQEIRPISSVIKWMENSAKLGFIHSSIALGNVYEKGGTVKNGPWGRETVQQDYHRAFNHWKSLADRNISIGYCCCAEYLQYGKLAAPDIESAIKYYRKSIETNNSGKGNTDVSYSNLASCYKSLGDDSSAFNVMSEAYDKGFYLIANNLGEFYKNKKGSFQDLKKAYEIFETGMNNCSFDFVKSLCKFQLAMLLKDGSGCTKDIPRAVRYLEEADNEGIQEATYALSQLAYDTKDYEKSFKLCTKIINMDNKAPDAILSSVCSTLAKMYTFGRGVPVNEKEAEEWWNKAANFGDADARKIQEWLNVTM